MLNTTIHGQGHPLIWAHGLMGSMDLESATGWFHSPAGHIRRIRYDARGHGRSPAGTSADEHRWDRLAQDMLDVASEHAGQECFALGGQSMGCATALYAALTAPQQVSRLVLALPPTAWSSRPAQVERYGKMLDLIHARGVASLVSLARQFPSVPGWLHHAQPEANEQALREMARFDKERLSKILEGAMHSDLPPPSRLATLQMPALILAWADDSIHPLATARHLKQTLPNARLVEIDTLGQLNAWPNLIDEFIGTSG